MQTGERTCWLQWQMQLRTLRLTLILPTEIPVTSVVIQVDEICTLKSLRRIDTKINKLVCKIYDIYSDKCIRIYGGTVDSGIS